MKRRPITLPVIDIARSRNVAWLHEDRTVVPPKCTWRAPKTLLKRNPEGDDWLFYYPSLQRFGLPRAPLLAVGDVALWTMRFQPRHGEHYARLTFAPVLPSEPGDSAQPGWTISSGSRRAAVFAILHPTPIYFIGQYAASMYDDSHDLYAAFDDSGRPTRAWKFTHHCGDDGGD